jgi:hypothetical protein
MLGGVEDKKKRIYTEQFRKVKERKGKLENLIQHIQSK